MRIRDAMNKAGAEELAKRIRAYWAGKGISVAPEIVREPDPSGSKEFMYVVRSTIKFESVR